uniref:Phage protein n=1 Tax=Meloidogyne hapla TaxID=6305 RepID=A0A1I8BWF6_MELHA
MPCWEKFLEDEYLETMDYNIKENFEVLLSYKHGIWLNITEMQELVKNFEYDGYVDKRAFKRAKSNMYTSVKFFVNHVLNDAHISIESLHSESVGKLISIQKSDVIDDGFKLIARAIAEYYEIDKEIERLTGVVAMLQNQIVCPHDPYRYNGYGC